MKENRWYHQLDHVTGVYFGDQKPFVADCSENEKWSTTTSLTTCSLNQDLHMNIPSSWHN